MALFKTTIFTVLVPGMVMVVVPWLALRFGWELAVLPVGLARWAGPVAIAVGALGYLTCALDFAITGEGTPAPIDPPRRLVTGPGAVSSAAGGSPSDSARSRGSGA